MGCQPHSFPRRGRAENLDADSDSLFLPSRWLVPHRTRRPGKGLGGRRLLVWEGARRGAMHARPSEGTWPSVDPVTAAGMWQQGLSGAIFCRCPSPAHTAPLLLSIWAGCPQTLSSLPPDAKAPAAAPEPGTTLAAAGKAWFPEVTGQQG